MDKMHMPVDPMGVDEESIGQYLSNFKKEISNGIYSPDELLLLHQDDLYGKYLNKSNTPFFKYHFLPLWVNSVKTLFNHGDHPTVIELGCGTGASSLLFSLLGARVIGIEMNEKLINICNKRKRYYEQFVGELQLEYVHSSTFDYPYAEGNTIDAYYSLFAFNLMKPTADLLDILIPSLNDGGQFIVIDGNAGNIYSKILPSRRRPGVLTPSQLADELQTRGCKIDMLFTQCAIPQIVFKNRFFVLVFKAAEKMLKILNLHRYFGASYSICAINQGKVSQ
jgi:SAM-dependent methyltransferase